MHPQVIFSRPLRQASRQQYVAVLANHQGECQTHLKHLPCRFLGRTLSLAHKTFRAHFSMRAQASAVRLIASVTSTHVATTQTCQLFMPKHFCVPSCPALLALTYPVKAGPCAAALSLTWCLSCCCRCFLPAY